MPQYTSPLIETGDPLAVRDIVAAPYSVLDMADSLQECE